MGMRWLGRDRAAGFPAGSAAVLAQKEQECCQPGWVELGVFILALGLVALLLAHFHDHSWYAPDEGAYADVAARMLDGQVLHREVGDLHAGTINFINAGAFRVWGRSLLALRYALVVAGVLQAVVVLFLLWRGGRGSTLTAALGAVAVTALGLLQFLNPTAHWYALLLFFVTAWALVWLPDFEAGPGTAAGSRNPNLHLLLLGFLVGSQFLLRQLSGVFLAMGVVAWVLWRWPLGSTGEMAAAGRRPFVAAAVFAVMALGLAAYLVRWPHPAGSALFGIWPLAVLGLGIVRARLPDRVALRALGTLMGGALLAALPLLLYHLHHGTLGRWFEDAVLSANAQSRSSFIAERSFLPLVTGGLEGLFLGRSGWERLNGLYWAVLPLAGAVLGGLVLWALVRAPRRPARSLDALPVLALFHGLVSVHHQIPIYLFYSLPATVAALLWITGGEAKRGAHPTVPFRAITISAVALFTFVAVAFHAGQPWSRPWGDLLAGRKTALVPAAGIPRCGLLIPERERLEVLRQLALIEAEVAPGEPIFALPMQPELYFLSGRPNPTRFFNFAFAVRGAADAGEVLDILAEAEPALIFYNPRDKYTTPEVEAFAARLQSPEGLPGTAGLRYVAGETVGDLEVLRRVREVRSVEE